jgi:hypothetical protein
MQTTFLILHSFPFARLAFYRLSFTHINFTHSFSLSLSLSVCVCLCLCADDGSCLCLHVLSLMMRGTLRNTSETVTHDCTSGWLACFMVLLDNVLYDGHLIHACLRHTSLICFNSIVHLSLLLSLQ